MDPIGLSSEAIIPETFLRRQREVCELVQKKGGLIISIFRPNAHVPVPNFNIDRYTLLGTVDTQVVAFIRSQIKAGEGSIVKLIHSAKGPLAGYFQVLKGNLGFSAYLESAASEVAEHSGVTFALNSLDYPISVSFAVGEGILSLVPVAHNVTADRMGAAIVRVVRAHFENQAEVETPDWCAQIVVPGADVHDGRIMELRTQMDQIGVEITTLERKRDELSSLLGLLFGYGKVVLESQVRVALRLFGFVVSDPEEYDGEWDVDLADTQSGRTGIGEVEGSEGPIDVDKYRQLLDYIEAESIEGRDHKGILIGNGFRLKPPDAPERQRQFSDHALRGAARNRFCLLPTAELFKAACAVLETPDDEGLKIKLRESILTRVGVWEFVR